MPIKDENECEVRAKQKCLKLLAIDHELTA